MTELSQKAKPSNIAVCMALCFNFMKGEYSLLGCYYSKELAEKRRALLQKRDDEIIKMAKNYEEKKEYFVVESQINKET